MVASGGWGEKEVRYHPHQKRLLMVPLNNQPNSSSVFEVGRFFHKEQTKYRLEGGAQGPGEGCHHSDIVLPRVIRTHHRPGAGATVPSGNRLAVVNQGLICTFHAPPAARWRLSFLGRSVGVFVQCFHTSTGLVLKAVHAVWLSLASWLEAVSLSF